MEVIVVGAGQAGNHIAQVLSMENHDVTVIDINRARLQRVEDSLDVRTICDHGASPQALEAAGAQNAHLVAAVTDSDEVNLIASVTARQLGIQDRSAGLQPGLPRWWKDRIPKHTGYRSDNLAAIPDCI